MESDVECVYRDQKLLIDVCSLLPSPEVGEARDWSGGGLLGLGFHALRLAEST